MAYYLGVDGGGTKTDFLLADEERELGRVRTGSIKRLRLDAETTGQNLRQALDELTAITGISMHAVTRCCVGAGGVTAPTTAGWIESVFAHLVGGELLLLEDVEIALDAAFQGSRGVLVLAGTGSQIAGRDSDGKYITGGGWGPAMADQGSGYFLGLGGLRRGFLAIDQERPTQLLDAIMAHWHLPTLPDLVEFANANPSPDFSQLAPLVAELAAEGDSAAIEVVREGGAELAYLATLVIERIRKAEAASGEEFVAPPIALAGSVLARVALAREALGVVLRQGYPEIEISDTATDPVQGALWRARRGY